MTITAQSVIKDAQVLLKDTAGIRWTAAELVDALNAAQREIATLRPDLMATSAAYALAAGARQAVPANCSKLMDIPRNTTGPAIRQVQREDLDAINRDWYTLPGATVIKHFTHDAKQPNVFWVYPPAASGVNVDIEYAALPADIPAPGAASFTGVTGNLGVADVFANAAMHFVLSRAYAKDAQAGGNAVLSAEHERKFRAAMGDDLTTRQAVKPAIKPTPD
jgi:hypothetical protein